MQKDQISYSQTEGGTSNNNPLLALVTLGKSGQEQPPSLCGLHRLVPTVATDR